jgi:ATP-dependent Clp protease adaptor protein ClpS
MPEDNTSNNTQTIIEDKVKRPSMYEVVLLNDDYTPMEFVVDVLSRYFNKDIEQSNQIMMHVHRNGKGLCGIYPFDIAETKVMQVMNYSIKNGHPLQCKMEKNK